MAAPTDIEETVLEFTTLAIPVPVLNSYECEVLSDEITCTFDFDETGFDSGVNYIVLLMEGTDVIDSDYFTESTFEVNFNELENNTDYFIRILGKSKVAEYFASGFIGDYNTPTHD